ncbi:hypothetical protein CVU83_01895 [Candidatus Falkowbacteria bacterium HGW-Falkowbacteria-2]|uniref:Uncharacterized protein n=1 Tax=Candidatus Falkowbacteria bacterium HGW-Falkowbacteria-2 TaxID=2013769 RepID=A0A2N2E0V4_9BACT|nr:MAG: hypothetical protein CVU83_01895 [Candidatus Falkowbacteria bacterium HGW-Falkowbacteria-2]
MKTWAAGEDVYAVDLNANFNEAAFMYFGDGSDGDVIISVNTSLARDMYYKNLTINNGIVLNPNGYRIFVKETLTYVGTGKVSRNGNNGTNGGQSGNQSDMTPYRSAGGAALASGTIFGGLAGGYGGFGGTSGGYGYNADAGQAGSNVTYSLPAVAGVGAGSGGAGTGGPLALGGIGGTITNVETLAGTLTRIMTLASATYNAENNAGIFEYILLKGSNSNTTLSSNAGSAGGGGGGQSGAFSQAQGGCGGGGGGNGGVIYIAAFNIVTVNGNTFVEAKGGNGGNGGNGGAVSTYHAGGGGGGAGGQGGFVLLIYKSLTGTGVIDVSGGTKGLKGLKGGASGADGADGNNGNTGKYIKIKIV